MKIVALLFFIAGLAVAVVLRLHHGDHGDHANHGAAANEVEFNLINQPLKDGAGADTTLAQITAKDGRLLINFWATWCAPCVREMPLLQQAQAQHNIPTIGISYEELATIQEFRTAHTIDYPLYKSAFDIFYFFQQQGNRTAVMPYTVLIDTAGNVLKTKVGDFADIDEINDFVIN